MSVQKKAKLMKLSASLKHSSLFLSLNTGERNDRSHLGTE